MAMTEPRIAPGSRSDIGWINWIIATVAGRVAGTGPPNLFRTLARHRSLFRGWLRFAGRLMPRGRLPRRETELAILRVAHLCNSEYEFDHHVRLMSYAVGSKRLVSFVKRKVKSGHSVGFRPVGSRYQLVQPPRVQTVLRILD